MKENYRANLPVFMKLFDGISKYGEFIKNVIQKTDIKLNKPSLVINAMEQNAVGAKATILTNGVAANVAADSGLLPEGYRLSNIESLPTRLDEASISDENQRISMISIIDAITSGAYTLSSSAGDVLRELADDPKFFQTNENSIELYKSRNGKLPIMPISLVTFALDGNNGPSKSVLLPDYNLGDPKFKFLYGTRGILSKNAQQVSWDKIQGVKSILDTYNGSLQKRDQVDPDRYLKFINDTLTLFKFSIDTSYYFNLLIPVDFMLNAPVAHLLNNTNETIRTYESNKNDNELTTILDIVESTDQDSKIGVISQVVGLSDLNTGNNRSNEWLLNLIELNVSPINVHALMREMPLVNTYNYAYTLDQLAEELAGSKIFDKTNDVNNIKSAKSLFVNLIGDPYIPITQQQYGHDSRVRGTNGLVHRLFVGDTDIPGLGRPKFLSDQVFNKALFGSLLPTSQFMDPAGLTAANAMARGRDGLEYKPSQKVRPQLNNDNVEPSSRKRVMTALQHDDSNNTSYTNVYATSDGKSYLQNIGKSRFDTKLVRNIFFIMNVWRLLRLKLDRELTQYHSVVTRGNGLVNPSLTEYDQDNYGQYETAKDAFDDKYLETRKS